MSILERIWSEPYLAYVLLRDPIIIILVLYFTIVGWNEHRLVNKKLRTTTIILLVFYFAIMGIGVILSNWIFDLILNGLVISNWVFDLNLKELFIDGLALIGVAYGLWNLQKWAGILGIFLTIETVAVNIYIDTFSSEFWYGSVLKYSWDGLIIILIMLNWNNLTPKSLIEYFNPVKKWLHDR